MCLPFGEERVLVRMLADTELMRWTAERGKAKSQVIGCELWRPRWYVLAGGRMPNGLDEVWWQLRGNYEELMRSKLQRAVYGMYVVWSVSKLIWLEFGGRGWFWSLGETREMSFESSYSAAPGKMCNNVLEIRVDLVRWGWPDALCSRGNIWFSAESWTGRPHKAGSWRGLLLLSVSSKFLWPSSMIRKLRGYNDDPHWTEKSCLCFL